MPEDVKRIAEAVGFDEDEGRGGRGMKCRAKEILDGRKMTKVMRAFGLHVLEEVEAECALILLEEVPWYRRDERLSEFYAGQAAQLEHYLERNAVDHLWIDDPRRGRREADTSEYFTDAVNGTVWELRRDLEAAGLDAAAIWDRATALMPDRQPLGRDARIMSEARVSWYAYNGRSAIQSWIGSSALYLAGLRYPCGRRRIPLGRLEQRIILPLADRVRAWVSRWCEGTEAADQELARRHREQIARLEQVYGIELRPSEEADGVHEVAHAERAAPGRPLPPVFEALMVESTRARIGGAG